MKSFLFPAESISDAYKQGMSVLHDIVLDEYRVKILSSYSNFTPRKNCYMTFSPLSKGTITIYGLRQSFQVILDLWDDTFFDIDKEVVLKRLRRRTKHIFGSTEEHAKFLSDISDLHDIGYLPIEVRAIDEGTKYPIGLPVFTTKSTLKGFGWLVNFIETISSGLVWPMINTATKVEQFYIQAKHYGNLSAPEDIVSQWLPYCVHEFGMRGYRGMEDQVRTSSASALFFKGNDTMAVADFFEHYHNSDMEVDSVISSVRATEHADISRLLSTLRYLATKCKAEGNTFMDVDPQDVLDRTELYALKWLLENSTGILSYVSDVEDYYRLLNEYLRELKDLVLSRKDREDGQPARFVARPDSSVDRPLNIICGYPIYEVEHVMKEGDNIMIEPLGADQYIVLKDLSGKYMRSKMGTRKSANGPEVVFNVINEISKVEAEGSLMVLWDIFGGEEIETKAGLMKFINPKVSLIYGEAISQTHQLEIYKRAIEMGFSVTNIIMGKGSYASLENSTRDMLSMAYKQTFSTADINGEDVDLAMFKKPLGDASKASARGLLRVSLENGVYTLHEDQTVEQEQTGELKLLIRDGVFYKKQTLEDIQKVYLG